MTLNNHYNYKIISNLTVYKLHTINKIYHLILLKEVLKHKLTLLNYLVLKQVYNCNNLVNIFTSLFVRLEKSFLYFYIIKINCSCENIRCEICKRNL